MLNLHTLTHAAEDVGFSEGHPFLDSSTGNEDGLDGSDESKLGGDEMHKCPECTRVSTIVLVKLSTFFYCIFCLYFK